VTEQNTEKITKILDSMFIELKGDQYSKIRSVLKIAYTELINKRRPEALIIMRLNNSISTLAIADKLTFTKQFHLDYAALKKISITNDTGSTTGGAMAYSGNYIA